MSQPPAPKSSRLRQPVAAPWIIRAWCGKCRIVWVWEKRCDKATRHRCPEHGWRLRPAGEGTLAELQTKGFRVEHGIPPKAPNYTPAEVAEARRAFYFKLVVLKKRKTKRHRGQGPVGRKLKRH